MEMFSSGKEGFTAFHFTYSSVKEEAREEMMGYRDVEPQKRILDWNSVSVVCSSPVLSPASASFCWPQATSASVMTSASRIARNFFMVFASK